jgi:hypothetical protein
MNNLIKQSKFSLNPILYFFFGSIVAFVIIKVSFTFYIGIGNPYLVAFTLLLFFEIFKFVFYRNKFESKKIYIVSLMSGILFFVFGFLSSFHIILNIYPLNF